jgi:hypothetical protein
MMGEEEGIPRGREEEEEEEEEDDKTYHRSETVLHRGRFPSLPLVL